jgi:uncharacterized protein
MAPAETLPVEVVYCPQPGVCEVVSLRLPEGATLADALAASGLLARHGLPPDVVKAGIWGRLREPATVLRAQDRVEIYRALLVDPKEARRQRYKRQRQVRATA